MKVTQVELYRSQTPIPLPEPWAPAWWEPSGKPFTSLDFAFYKVYTDEGIVGIGPYTGGNPAALALGVDPFQVGGFWQRHMSGARSENAGKGAAGLESALWDIVGKAAGLPLYKLMGAGRDRMPVYAAVSRLLEPGYQIEQIEEMLAVGFKAVKLRMHRQNPWDDLAVIQAVHDALGDRVVLLVDANQNNVSEGYAFWSRATALTMAQELDALGLYYLEEPLPRKDVEGLAEIAASVTMFIAGGEHSPTVYDFKPHALAGAYDIFQPDVSLTGNIGITGLQHVAAFADYFERLMIPHVLGSATTALHLAATLPAMAAASNCPWVEYPYDPPVLTPATLQALICEPILVEADGCVTLPDKPGLGVELNEEWLADKVAVSQTVKL